MRDRRSDAGSVSGVIAIDPGAHDYLEHEIRVQATRAGMDVEGRCAAEILIAWADRDLVRDRADSLKLARAQELELENRELRKQLQQQRG